MTPANIAGIITAAKKAEYDRILQLFKTSDSACAQWAAGVIEAAKR